MRRRPLAACLYRGPQDEPASARIVRVRKGARAGSILDRPPRQASPCSHMPPLAGGIAGFSLRPPIMHAAVALAAEGRLEVLADPSRIVSICKECSNGGMDELVKMGKSGRGSERCEGSIDRLARGAA